MIGRPQEVGIVSRIAPNTPLKSLVLRMPSVSLSWNGIQFDRIGSAQVAAAIHKLSEPGAAGRDDTPKATRHHILALARESDEDKALAIRSHPAAGAGAGPGSGGGPTPGSFPLRRDPGRPAGPRRRGARVPRARRSRQRPTRQASPSPQLATVKRDVPRRSATSWMRSRRRRRALRRFSPRRRSMSLTSAGGHVVIVVRFGMLEVPDQRGVGITFTMIDTNTVTLPWVPSFHHAGQALPLDIGSGCNVVHTRFPV